VVQLPNEPARQRARARVDQRADPLRWNRVRWSRHRPLARSGRGPGVLHRSGPRVGGLLRADVPQDARRGHRLGRCESAAEVARVLALVVGHFRARYGEVSIEESLEMLRTERFNDEQANILADGRGLSVAVQTALATPEGNITIAALADAKQLPQAAKTNS
jgi:hypothetical protein